MPGGVDSGGQNVYVDRVAKNLIDLGFDVDIFTRWEDSGFDQVIEYDSHIRIIHVKAGPVKIIPKEEIFIYMDDFAKNMLVFIKTEKSRYEIIHAHFWMSGYVAMK